LKGQIQAMLSQALAAITELVPADAHPEEIQVERTRDARFGDFASNLAMVLAKPARLNPREIAQALIDALPQSDLVVAAEIAGPGFINFRIAAGARRLVIPQILAEADSFGSSDIGAGSRVIVEFVSANPTGPLHVGHGRNAAFGDSLSRLLLMSGHAVQREYYVNDAGRQTDILTVSLWCRYLESCGEPVRVPSAGYPGDYVTTIAAGIRAEHGDRFRHEAATVLADLPADAMDGDEKEAYIDALITRARELLGADDYDELKRFGINIQRADIQATLEDFGVNFDRWFSERSLVEKQDVSAALERLRAAGHTYKKGGALWLASEALGDEKDRVLVKEDGSYTYLASDVAYHVDKLDRGFDTLIDVWGADHHGYVARVRAAIQALTGHGERFHAPLIQFVTLASGKMGKRSGNFVTLRDLIDEVGADATRYFYLSRSNDQHLEFDLELAKSRSNDNPVYYIQYAHARVCSVLKQLEDKGFTLDLEMGAREVGRLDAPQEDELLTQLARFPEIVEVAARNEAPHAIAHYLRDLAQAFHTYYNAQVFLVDEAELRNARLSLILAARQVIRNGLDLLGVSAPESM
jgi:arginyl-tRNA synthetase